MSNVLEGADVMEIIKKTLVFNKDVLYDYYQL